LKTAVRPQTGSPRRGRIFVAVFHEGYKHVTTPSESNAFFLKMPQ
ncbi:MAG: hypothetical protein ACJA1O_003402, partial [Spirosomataceae bacterium]